VDECIRFIEAKGLHRCSRRSNGKACVKATGGGAFRFNEVRPSSPRLLSLHRLTPCAPQLFEQRLGLTLDKEDEMASLVSGATFLLQELRDEAFTFVRGSRAYMSYTSSGGDSALFPYLLVNVGSGVSILRVDESGHERVSGTNMGGGTFWGLCRLLTGAKDFDEMLELSARGDNSQVDMLVGDIYGGVDYSKALGLSASTIAASFGKVVMDIDKPLESYRKEDLALSLLRMISYNIAHIAVLNAMRLGLKRIFFGGFFIRGHAYTMDTISFAINFWSKGELSAMFLRHEGFLGALGAFLRHCDAEAAEGGQPPLPPLLARKGSWIERFIRTARPQDAADAPPAPPSPGDALAAGGAAGAPPSGDLHVGVLHLMPSLEPFPLLARRGAGYVPDTLDLVTEPAERAYWLGLLMEHLPSLVEKAVRSAGGVEGAAERGAAFAATFRELLRRVLAEPAAYGQLSLAGIFEMREECLRAFQFPDAYRPVKDSENAAALAVLPDLLAELDCIAGREERLRSIVEGVLAGNIFDWGSRAAVELYTNGTILDIYRQARTALARPFGIDDLDAAVARLAHGPPHKRALLFCDNSGADLVLGMLPLARELLARGTDVVLVANTLPALNDITARELVVVLREAAALDAALATALDAAAAAGPPSQPGASSPAPPGAPARLWTVDNGHGSPCLDLRRVSHELCAAAQGADLVVLEGMGRAVHTNLRASFSCDALKLAMIKNGRLAAKIFGGSLYDCVCKFEPAPPPEDT
jgi:type II pantothenate kinase